MNKIFFDANILLDILLPSRLNHKKAVLAYKKICQDFEVLSTSENILTTIKYIASKNKTDCKVIWSFFDSLRKNFELYSFSNILEESLVIYHDSCLKQEKIDFEDLLQLQCAIKNGCDIFITENKMIHKNNFEIKVVDLNTILQV